MRRAAASGDAGPRVAELHAALDALAPFAVAADRDNVGLLAGRMDWPARRVLLAIDLTDAVATEALGGRCEAVIAYHPPIFKGIRSVTARTEAPTALLPDLLAARVSILSVHTALDAAIGGTNDVLLDFFETTSRGPLEPTIADGREYKLAVFVPAEGVERLRQALSAAGAGVIGHYGECSFELDGHGTFRGDETTRPAIGEKLTLERVPETRLEMLVPAARLGAVVRALYANHAYEEPAFDVYPLRTVAGRGQNGMGRIGLLGRATRGTDLLDGLRGSVDLSAATFVGDLRRRFASVTAAAGSFGVRSFRDPASLVLTGEMKHHDALELLRRGVSAIVLGHYASERPALESLAQRLAARMRGVRFKVSKADRTPLRATDELLDERAGRSQGARRGKRKVDVKRR